MTVESPDSLPEDEPRGSDADAAANPEGGEIPGGDEGVGVGATDEPNTFEPEEAGEAAED